MRIVGTTIKEGIRGYRLAENFPIPITQTRRKLLLHLFKTSLLHLQPRRKDEVASAKAAAKTAKAAQQVTRKEDVASAKAAKEAEKIAAAALKKAAKEAGELVAAALKEAATQRKVRLLLLVRTCSRTTISTTTTTSKQKPQPNPNHKQTASPTPSLTTKSSSLQRL